MAAGLVRGIRHSDPPTDPLVPLGLAWLGVAAWLAQVEAAPSVPQKAGLSASSGLSVVTPVH